MYHTFQVTTFQAQTVQGKRLDGASRRLVGVVVTSCANNGFDQISYSEFLNPTPLPSFSQGRFIFRSVPPCSVLSFTVHTYRVTFDSKFCQ